MHNYWKQLWAVSRKASSTVIIVIAVLAAGFGLIVDAPEAIKMLTEKGPQWISNPDAWWVGSIVLIAFITLMVIWKRPERDPKLEILLTFAKYPQKIRRIAQLLYDLNGFHLALLQRTEPINAEFVFNQLELVYPLQIEKALGSGAAEKFNDAVRNAKKAGPFVACNAAMPLVEDMIWERLEEIEYEEVSEQPSVKQIPPPALDTPDSHK